MCSIAGAIGWVSPTQHLAVQRMNDAQTHRGPDDGGSWSSRPTDAPAGPGVVFGHRRLSILDLSPLGHQPMVDEASGCVIVFNGEVYNFQTLRQELCEAGVTFRSHTDTEVILAAYARWGEASLSRLRGMFALAIWDPRREHVLLARDRLGIKPLYYTLARGMDGRETFYFASELRALLASGQVPRKIDEVGLASYLWNGVVVGPRTLVRDCRLLPQGTTMHVGLNGKPRTPQRYWQLPQAQPIGAAEAREQLQVALRDAVRLRLVADVPLGVFLSGGIDSSAVSALAVAASQGPVTTFNIGFDEARYDESGHARRVAQVLGTDHHEVRLTQATFQDQLEDALHSLDQPTFDAINTYFVSRAVREAGLTVALAGTGGDELFGGYPSFRELPRARQVARPLAGLPAPLIGPSAKALTRMMTGRFGEVPPQTRWGKLADVLRTGGDLLRLYQVSYGLFTMDFLQELGADMAHAPHGVPRERLDELAGLLDGQPELHAISMLETSFFLGERLLRDTDTASMAVSLEVRVPLLDHEVVEALARVPEPLRYQPLGRKQLLRDLGMPGLDPALFDRPKAGFELPLDVWCKQALRDDIDALFGDERRIARLGLDPAAVQRLWRAFQAEAPGLYWSRIWSLYILLWWCRAYDLER